MTGYVPGREANSQYGESLNGIQIDNARSHQFRKPTDPYVIPGEASSGLLPRIHAGAPGKQGEGDKRVQAYNYRVCLTRNPENRVPFPKPTGYDPKQYELLLRTLQAGSGHISGKFDMLPNLKTDTNNHGSFSTDNMDSHNTQRYVDKDGHVRNEGDVQINPGGPCPIDYGALIPKMTECENLLAPVCGSCTHIAFGSIRMEPVFMILGQSASTAAVLAIDGGIAVQEVDYELLKAKLLEDKQVLEYARK